MAHHHRSKSPNPSTKSSSSKLNSKIETNFIPIDMETSNEETSNNINNNNNNVDSKNNGSHDNLIQSSITTTSSSSTSSSNGFTTTGGTLTQSSTLYSIPSNPYQTVKEEIDHRHNYNNQNQDDPTKIGRFVVVRRTYQQKPAKRTNFNLNKNNNNNNNDETVINMDDDNETNNRHKYKKNIKRRTVKDEFEDNDADDDDLDDEDDDEEDEDEDEDNDIDEDDDVEVVNYIVDTNDDMGSTTDINSNQYSYSYYYYNNHNDTSTYSNNSHQINVQPHVEVLISRLRNEVVKSKNFNNEVRAGRDVKSFLDNPCVLLDLNSDSVEEIIDDMLHAINQDLDVTLLAQARASLYDSKNAYQLTDFLQGIYHMENGDYLHDPTWLCTFATVNNLPTRRIVIARLQRPSNFGPTLSQVQLIILVLVPLKEKTYKSAYEIARTFASLFCDSSLRMSLLTVTNQIEFCRTIEKHAAYLKRRHSSRVKSMKASFSFDKLEGQMLTSALNTNNGDVNNLKQQNKRKRFVFGKGLIDDFKRRIKYYPSDFIDGIRGENTLSKVSAAILSIFFACILPPIAFGVVNEHTTHGIIGPKQGLIGQAIGGLIFALTAGQPLVIIATTAPLTLYVAIVYQASQDWKVDFLDLFAAVGCFCAFYLILYALLNVSNLMRYVTRSTEEIFATFVFVAFTAAAFGECRESFKKHYCFDNTPVLRAEDAFRDCLPAKSILFLFLMLGTVAMAVLLYNFSSTPFLNTFLRGILADYALPLSVITFSAIGTAVFYDVHADTFAVNPHFEWRIATFQTLTWPTFALAAFLGFFLSMLFFIAQSVCASIVASPSNHLKKGTAFHWDLFVLGSLNAVLSMLGLPWIYGVLPHSPLHTRLLADVVPATDSQHQSTKSYVVVRVRETRVTGVLVHVLIGAVVLLIPNSLTNIPVAVLCGLFLYCAISTLRNNSIRDRVVLVLTEQHSYPPTSYLRHVPQRTVHCFTATQIALLCLISFIGFCPWKNFRLFFPFMIALMIPIRRFVLPMIFDEKHLKIIDSKHY